MNKISKQTKRKEIYDYLHGICSIKKICHKYHVDNKEFRMILATYCTHGTDALFNLPTVTPEFRV